MKNLKHLFIVVVFIAGLCHNNLYAQGIYIQLNPGYAFGSGSITYPGFANYQEYDNYETTEVVGLSLGKGLNIGGAFGAMLTENFGVELGLSYLLGGKTKFSYEDFTSSPPYTEEYAAYSRMLRINPSLVVSAGFNTLEPYAKLGLVVGIGSFYQTREVFSSPNTRYWKYKYSGGVGIGVSGALGALLNVSDFVAVFGELAMVNMSYGPSKSEMVEYEENGLNMLMVNYPNVRQRETEYVNSITWYANQPPPNDMMPRQELKQKYPFGSFGVNIGLRISF